MRMRTNTKTTQQMLGGEILVGYDGCIEWPLRS